jgi:2',3'-cyclic-nucleotide 2'-phosphodiesterase (5'-nucleotidase family)
MNKVKQTDPDNSVDAFFAGHNHVYTNGVVGNTRIVQSTSQGLSSFPAYRFTRSLHRWRMTKDNNCVYILINKFFSFIGVVTTEIPNLVLAEHHKDYTFTDPAEEIVKYSKELVQQQYRRF